jgi:holin-like protein
MKYLSQLCIILGFTLLGEALQRLLPLGIPASVYGLVLLFLALCAGLVKLPQVKEAGTFLTSILPLLFVAPTVGIVEHWSLIQPRLLSICLLILSSTVLVFGVSGAMTQHLIRKGESGNDHAS